MFIRCECSSFTAKMNNLAEATPGLIVCYCRDCQAYLKKLSRTDLLDRNGGTEILPVYPRNIEFVTGSEYLKCNLLSERGLHRWSAKCCNTPIANTKSGFPWAGIISHCLKLSEKENESTLDNELGPIRCRVMAKYALRKPKNASQKIHIRDFAILLPFIFLGFIKMKQKHSPFYLESSKDPLSSPIKLT
jgi:hypothetical protein